ncbi:MAG TPA: SDR family oxidoreductase [Jatrophihabitantaceae bacterium]|jgi:short-subunit dehydrogenase|nr:SDR family oxidoreductase [Jatrophihabitantaceae bacterium]
METGPERTAVVTGASSGIGEQIARELSRRGQHVTLVARSADKLHALAAELEAAGGGADVVQLDLGDRSARAALPERIAALGLVVDALVNNAGLSTFGPVASSTPDAELHMIEIDIAAVADLCTRFVPGMIERGHGAILNVASTAAFQPLPGQAGYAAAKAFVLSYTQALSGELRGTGVTATALCPGPVHTGFADNAGIPTEDAEAALPGILWVDAPTVAKHAVDAMLRGRMVVVPGTANRMSAALSQLAPRRLIVPMIARRHPGMRAKA